MPEPVSVEVATEIVEEIADDLRGRSGFDHLMGDVDEDIITEMLEGWVRVIVTKTGGVL